VCQNSSDMFKFVKVIHGRLWVYFPGPGVYIADDETAKKLQSVITKRLIESVVLTELLSVDKLSENVVV